METDEVDWQTPFRLTWNRNPTQEGEAFIIILLPLATQPSGSSPTTAGPTASHSLAQTSQTAVTICRCCHRMVPYQLWVWMTVHRRAGVASALRSSWVCRASWDLTAPPATPAYYWGRRKTPNWRKASLPSPTSWLSSGYEERGWSRSDWFFIFGRFWVEISKCHTVWFARLSQMFEGWTGILTLSPPAEASKWRTINYALSYF